MGAMKSSDRRCLCGIALCGVFTLFARTAHADARVATLEVDATDAALHIVHVRQTLPLPPGSVALVFPKWLPGEHGPTGPINDVVNLRVRAAGKDVPWVRDSGDAYTLRLQLPEGTSTVDVAFDAVTGVGGRGAPSPANASTQLMILKWNTMLLYPQGAQPSGYRVAASVRLPAGWAWATTLTATQTSPSRLRFAPTSLETLIDSPLLAGVHTRSWDLSPAGGPSHTLFAAGESERALDLPPQTLQAYKQLVKEAGALFGARPYSRYVFLLALSNHVPHGGLEHHESSDNRVFEDTWNDDAKRLFRSGLLPHELVHSWNGKHRRPEGLVTADFQQAYDTRLLWVYEGLTSYLGEVLTARAGLRTAEQARETLALTAAGMDAQTGRQWRSLADTATSAPVLGHAVKQWRNVRRGLDYYPEGVLLWLEVDGIIRSSTSGTKSLDDFCKAFFGTVAGKPSVLPYNREQLLNALSLVAAYDWDAYFKAKVDNIVPAAALSALDAVGWKQTFTAEPTTVFRAVEASTKEINLSFSLGLFATDTGAVVDVLPRSPAALARVAPAMQIVAVNGRRYTPERLRAAVEETSKRGWVEVLVEDAEHFSTRRVFWRQGPRVPQLIRQPNKPDLLSLILAPQAAKD